MRERSKKNIANILMVGGLCCLLYFENNSVPLALVGVVILMAGMATQMFFELKQALKNLKTKR